MESNNPQNPLTLPFGKIADVIIRLVVLFWLISLCVTILRPFSLILTWASVIAIAIYPLYVFFLRIFRKRKTLAAVVLTLIFLSLLLIPSWLLTQSLFTEIGHLRDLNNQGQLVIPPPGENTANWPSVAKPILDFWKLASVDLQEAMMKNSTQVKSVGAWVLTAIAGIGTGIIQFVVSIIIAGVLLAFSDPIEETSIKIFKRLAGNNGEHFASSTVTTVRSVVKGILGVAVIQASMAGIGFFVAGVPYAAVWSVAALILSIIQIGAAPVAIPIMIYMFSVADTLTAVLLSIWLVITLISDNILKPLLLGRSAPAPMLVVFLGAIGGFITSGFLGLFLGAVILTIGYKLSMIWLDSQQNESSTHN